MDNEGFTTCDLGHQHYGLGGAAGLMLHHQDPVSGTHRYLMQQRSPYVDHGGTWAPPSGALDPGEHPIMGALREAQEELGPFQSSNHQVAHTNDHGGWAFHTVTADTPHMFDPELDDESSDAAWLTPEEIDEMPLHPGFRESWNDLRPPPQQRTAKTASNPRERRIWSSVKFVPPLPETEGSTEPQEVCNPWDAWPEWGEQNNDQKTHQIQFGDSSTATI